MLFNSVHFLVFFPIVTLVYFVLPNKIRWAWLLVASYYFYMSWNPQYALLLAGSTVVTYACSILVDRANKLQDEKKRTFLKKMWVVLSLILNFSVLFFFKYFDFAVSNVNRVLAFFKIEVLQLGFDVLLPVGISFYIFQAIGYTIDVYRGTTKVEKNLARYALFISFFPQMVAGPIERSSALLPQMYEKHTFDYNRAKDGLLLMLWGFFKKMVLADRLTVIVDAIYKNPLEYDGAQIMFAVLIFSVQIYCDFSGYTDIAIGAAQILGFRLMQNFRQPYFAASIKEFWQRWHISLSTWFKDYLYIPLGGSRAGKFKTYRNILITFLVSGLWHGSSWNFIMWGGLHAVFQIISGVIKPYKEMIYKKLKVKKDVPSFHLGQTIVTFITVTITWVFFRANGFRQALLIISRMFTDFNIISLLFPKNLHLGLAQQSFTVAIISIVVLFVGDYLQTKMNVRQKLAEQNTWFRWAFYYIAFIFVFVFGVLNPGAPPAQFIYFQF